MLSPWLDFWRTAAGDTPLEWAAVVTGFGCVWLAARGSVWNFPLAIVSCGLYVVVFQRVALYSDRNLQVFFILLNLYGLWQWRRSSSSATAEVRVTLTRPGEWWVLGFAVAAYTLGFASYLKHYQPDAAYPYIDSLTTGVSLAAQYLLARKRLENWLLWIGVDLIYVPLYWAKHLQPTAGLYLLYLGLAAYGYRQWLRQRRLLPLSS